MKKTLQQPISWRRALGHTPWLALIPLGFLIPLEARLHPQWIENVYAARLYPPVKDAILTLTGWIPFSFAEALAYALCILIPALLVFWIVRAVRSRGIRLLLRGVISLGVAFGVVLNLFYFTWGLNYFRPPLAGRMNLETGGHTVEELEELTKSLAREAADLRAQVEEDEDGVFCLSMSRRELFAALPRCYEGLSEKHPVFSGKVGPAKPVLWSTGLSWAGISGIYIGLTAEPNVNVHQDDLIIPYAAAHEMAHQLGIASENEAEFTAFLAGMCSRDPQVRYSCVMGMLIRAGNALSGADMERYRGIAQSYSDGMRRDLAAHNAYWEGFEGPVEEAATQMNDNYLKHNDQPSGVRSYGEAVDLLLAYAAKNGLPRTESK